MSNQSDYILAISRVEDFIKENDISETVSEFNSDDIFDLREVLAKKYPIYDFWKDSAWNWLAKFHLEKLIESKGKKIK